ncbi:hypothetical protein CFC21_021003 [Triticum aestivum]|uniref:non-specific serine/threonine protein kinase n=3 Tax=Triticum TaxID=4564 RepID=A0A9R1RGL6_TRITD|nr:putative receptor-like protein kinase At4g00960 isoform X2 [Triticum aestivum]KAF7005908.1 hypothetical protein CFC21_021003 [Triticum aestivum]VAH40619.1 unnamed protein product [Triticum turgidum subsp. durum]
MADQASELEALELILTDANAEPTKLSYALIKSITTNFSQEIGLGGFGVVYLGVLRNEKVAVKKLFIEQDFSDELFVDEVNCLVRAKHNNIVRFLDYCADTQGELVKFDGRHVMAELRQRLLCFEYVPNGNLHDYIKGISHGDEWQIRYKMIKGICHGLQYLHKERITHLDLKPDNVLLDAYMEPKITDFGLSRLFDEGQSRVFTKNVPGTRGYIAPEVIDKGEISFKSDIFALGIVVSKLLVGQNNYDIENWHESLDVDCTQAKSCIQIAQSCMEADQHKRPTAEEIIKKLNEMESLGSSIYRTNSSDSENLIQVEPLELHFHLEPNTHISVTQKLKLANITDDYVAFNAMEWSSMAKYGFSWSGPSRGILLPWSTHELGLIREAHEMSPLSVQCNDVLIVRSTVVSEGFKTRYIALDMFKTHTGRKVHEVKLGILVVPSLAESSACTAHTLSMSPTENQDLKKAKEELHRLGLSAHERPHDTNAQLSSLTKAN